MGKPLVVKIPLKNPRHEVNASEIEELIVEHQSKFYELFERAIDIDDGRYQIDEGSLQVEQIEFDENQKSGVAEVEFMSDFYAGCKDMDSSDWHTESLPFKIVNGSLVFEINIPMRWRVDN